MRTGPVPGPVAQSPHQVWPLPAMGTLSCDPTPRLTAAPAGRRAPECQVPETTGLRRSCRLAAWENGSGPGLYVLPSTIGFVNHDCTRVAGPAYSLSRRPSEAPGAVLTAHELVPQPLAQERVAGQSHRIAGVVRTEQRLSRQSQEETWGPQYLRRRPARGQSTSWTRKSPALAEAAPLPTPCRAGASLGVWR